MRQRFVQAPAKWRFEGTAAIENAPGKPDSTRIELTPVGQPLNASITDLPTKLQGRWQRIHPQTFRPRGNATSIHVTSQTGARVQGKFTLYPQVDGPCETTIDAPLEGIWDGERLKIVARRAPPCSDFVWTVGRGKEHFLEGRRQSDPTFFVYYDPAN